MKLNWCHHVNIQIDVDDIAQETLSILEKMPEAGIIGKSEDTYTIKIESQEAYDAIKDFLDDNSIIYEEEVI